MAGAVVSGAIIMLWSRGDNAEKISVFSNMDELVTPDNTTGNIVNELMLSANELSIYGKSSLMEYPGNEDSQAAVKLLEQIRTDPDKAYQAILKNKLDRLKQQRASSSDFYVKPVPK